jgi:hypothetical protein
MELALQFVFGKIFSPVAGDVNTSVFPAQRIIPSGGFSSFSHA